MNIFNVLGISLAVSAASAAIPARAQGSLQATQPKVCTVMPDETGVYADFLSTKTGSAAITVVVNQTQPLPSDFSSLNSRFADRGPAIPSDVQLELTMKDASCSVPSFHAADKIRFIAEDDFTAIFKAGWDEFCRRYGKNASWLRFSRVGFNMHKTLAVLHVITTSGPKAGEGTLYHLERKAGKWVVTDSFATLIS